MLAVRDPYHLRIAAASVRIGLAAFVFFVLGTVYPKVGFLTPLVFAYLVISSVFLLLVVMRIGDRPRAIVGAVNDLFMLTILMHAIGSTVSVVSTLYVFAAALNTLTVGPRVGFITATLACTFYAGLLVAEYVFDFSMLRLMGRPPNELVSSAEAFASWLLTSLLVIATTLIVASLVRTNQARERQLREANDRLLALTNRDALTDLWNRRYLFQRIESAIAKGKLGRFALAVFDLDGFKAVNDTYGHLEGDSLLQGIACKLVEEAGPNDVVCRFGGDEFVVLLRHVDATEAGERVERMRRGVRDAALSFRSDCPVTASVGLTMSRPDDDAEALMRRADALAYTAKRRGRDRLSSDSEEIVAVS